LRALILFFIINILLATIFLMSGCAFKFVYGLQIEYEGNRDEIKEEVGRDEESKNWY
jgi:hypothetical protein